MAITLNTRIKHKNDTLQNWLSANPVLLKGEFAVVELSAGDVRIKVGDGLKSFSALPYIYNEEITSIRSAIDTIGNDYLTNDDKEDIFNRCIDEDELEQYANDRIFPAISASSNTYINGLKSDLSVVNINRDDYYDLVSTNLTLSNVMYIVSADESNLYGKRITNLGEPILSSDAATKDYVDNNGSATLVVWGGEDQESYIYEDDILNGMLARVDGRLSSKQDKISVNGLLSSDGNGNIVGTQVDFSDYYTKQLTQDLSTSFREGLATTSYVQDEISKVDVTEQLSSCVKLSDDYTTSAQVSSIADAYSNKVEEDVKKLSSDINSKVDDLSSEAYSLIATTNSVVAATNASLAAAMSKIPTKTSDISNDSGFLTAHQSLSNYDDKLSVLSSTMQNCYNKQEIDLLSSDFNEYVSQNTSRCLLRVWREE